MAQPDFVVVAGDWTYEPENKLVEELAILKQIEAPVYSVNGNHDEQYPGPPIQALLASALEANNVMDIEGKIVEFDDFSLNRCRGLMGRQGGYALYARFTSRQTVVNFVT